jgi:hypothetical protein
MGHLYLYLDTPVSCFGISSAADSASGDRRNRPFTVSPFTSFLAIFFNEQSLTRHPKTSSYRRGLGTSLTVNQISKALGFFGVSSWIPRLDAEITVSLAFSSHRRRIANMVPGHQVCRYLTPVEKSSHPSRFTTSQHQSTFEFPRTVATMVRIGR